MYTPKFNQVTDRAILLETMQTYSFAILCGPQSPGSESPMAATHLPLVVKDAGPHGLIEGHFAIANRHHQALAGRETLVIFPGPHSYVSPTLYVGLVVAGTVVFTGLPLLIGLLKQTSWRATAPAAIPEAKGA